MESSFDGSEVLRGAAGHLRDAKAAVAETLDDVTLAARRLLKRSRYAVEGCLEDTIHDIRRHPFGSLAVAFAAGAALGILVPRLGRKETSANAKPMEGECRCR